MICPVCGLELGVERRADELMLTYGVNDWAAGCRHRAAGDPASCAYLLPLILKELPKSTSFRSRTTEEESRPAC